MKKFILSLIFFCFLGISSHSGDIKVSWLPNAENEDVVYYYIYQKIKGKWSMVAQTFDIYYIFPDVPYGKYEYYIVAVNILGESPKSETVSIRYKKN